MQLPLFKSDALTRICQQVDQGFTFQLFRTESDYVAELIHDNMDLPHVGYSSVDPMQAIKRMLDMRGETS